MAITAIDYFLWQKLRDDGIIPQRPKVLEFGQANWYGDIDASDLAETVHKYADPREAEAILAKLSRAVEEQDLFAMARAFYRAMLQYDEIIAVDMHGTIEAVRHDLNAPLPLPIEHFDILINSGTAEHVFNQHQVWKSAHDHTKLGGIMVHAVPLWGWLDHGFVNYHPTFIADVAAVNDYELLLWCFAEMDTKRIAEVKEASQFRELAARYGTALSSMMYAVFRKVRRDDFKTPMQGYYAGRLTGEQERAWTENR
jgi:SAM-dependent methyltransferase